MSLYFDPHGNPVADVMEWVRAFEGPRHVGHTAVGDVRISTVFLGLDHQFGDGPPLIYETMVFGGPHDQEQWRYSTLDQAEVGHALAVELVAADGGEVKDTMTEDEKSWAARWSTSSTMERGREDGDA